MKDWLHVHRRSRTCYQTLRLVTEHLMRCFTGSLVWTLGTLHTAPGRQSAVLLIDCIIDCIMTHTWHACYQPSWQALCPCE
jgi:hypothetical protein